MSVQLRRLAPADLEHVVALQYKLFPREFCYSVAKTQEILAVPHIKGKNYSVGAFDNGQLVGYILMFDASSALYEGKRVALIWELAISLRYCPQLSQQFMEWIVREAHRCDLVVEARLRERTALRMLKREHRTVFTSRYRVTHIKEAPRTGNDRMVFFRFEPVTTRSSRLARGIDAVGVRVERLERQARVLPLRVVRRVCHALPRRVVPLPLLRRTYLVPHGAEPVNVRTDIG